MSLPPSKQASSTSGSATPTTPAIGLGESHNEAFEREMKNMKAVMAQQSRQLAALGQTLAELVTEVSSLKSKLG